MTANGTTNRATAPPPPLLSIQPIDFSLTDGTDIPAPTTTPSPSHLQPQPYPHARPRTPSLHSIDCSESAAGDAGGAGGGPLTSHPTTSTPSTSPARPSTLTQSRAHSSVRKLLGLSSLRSSFGSSRLSLALPPASRAGSSSRGTERPISARDTGSVRGKRAVSPGAMGAPPARRPRKSGGWMRRKSVLWFSAEADGGKEEALTSVREDHREVPEAEKPPVLPEISIGVGLGWNEVR